MKDIAEKRHGWCVMLAAAFLVGYGAPREARAQCDAPENLLFGIHIDPAHPLGNPSPSELQTVGARWVRIEWKVSSGFSFYDPVISNFRGNGMKVLLLVDYMSCSSGKPRSFASDAEWNTYLGTFVPELGAIALHYGDGVDAWEVWNEPDLLNSGTGYDPGVPAHKYGVMLRDAYAAIEAHSSRPVIVGGLASGDPGYLTQAVDAVGGLFADGVGVHPYGQRAPDDWPDPDWGFGNLSEFYASYLRFGAPLWVTEIGLQGPRQAEYLTNVYTLTRDSFLSDVPTVFWFCWHDDGGGGTWGLLDAAGNPKASYTSYQSIAPPWDPACGGCTGPCSTGDTETEDCGDCGTRTRTCNDDCLWEGWGPCGGEDPGSACETGLHGLCEEGILRCIDGDLECVQANFPEAEICGDLLDNDCNGEADEGCGCRPGETRSCGSDEGACRPGTQRCSYDGLWLPECEGEIGPQEEICNGIDDDCNGAIDDPPSCSEPAPEVAEFAEERSDGNDGVDGGHEIEGMTGGCGCLLVGSTPFLQGEGHAL